MRDGYTLVYSGDSGDQTVSGQIVVPCNWSISWVYWLPMLLTRLDDLIWEMLGMIWET